MSSEIPQEHSFFHRLEQPGPPLKFHPPGPPALPASSVFIDETEQRDTVVLGALIVPHGAESALREAWRDLRRRVRAALLAGPYPEARRRFERDPAWLPELHATELYRGNGPYRLGPNAERDLWRQHHRWYEEALGLLQQRGLRFASFLSSPHGPENRALLGAVPELVHPFGTAAQQRDAQTVLGDRQRFSLIDLLLVLAHLLPTHPPSRVVCDHKEELRGLQALWTLEWLREQGQLTHLRGPTLADSAGEDLLQACDLLCYLDGQGRSGGPPKPYDRDTFGRWAQVYLEPLREARDLRTPQDLVFAVAGMVGLLDLGMGGTAPERQQRREAFRALLTLLLEGETTMQGVGANLRAWLEALLEAASAQGAAPQQLDALRQMQHQLEAVPRGTPRHRLRPGYRRRGP